MHRKGLLTGLLVIFIGGGVFYFVTRGHARELVLTGIVTTDDVIVSSQIMGQLSSLLVKEGDTVTRDQLLAVIEPEEMKADQRYFAHSEKGYEAQVQEAEAALRYQELQTQEQIRQAEAALAATQAQQAEAAADLEWARLDYEREDGLFKQHIVSAQIADQARTAYQAAQAHLEAV